MASVNRIIQKASGRNIYSLTTLCSHKILSLASSSIGIGSHGKNKLPHQKSQNHLYSSDTKRTGRILTQSTLIVQDGVDIEELPILIKRATYDSFPFSSHTYSGDKFNKGESEFDTTFRQDLHNCYSVNDVFKLLEVPSEKVRGLSASLALQRLHVLKYLNTDWDQIHSFIRSAVMRELYDTVQRDVGLLSNNTLISLVECYLAAEGFSPLCIDAINYEIQSRLGDEVFSVEELLSLAHILKSSKDTGVKPKHFFLGLKSPTISVVSENSSRFLSNDDSNENQIKMEQFDKYFSKVSPQVREQIRMKCSELLDNVWVHLTSRYQDVDEHSLPLILQALTTDNKSIIKLLEKPLARCWTMLSAEGVGTCLDNLVRLRVFNTVIMTYLGRWAFVNIHQMTPPLLLSFLNTFLLCGFLDENLVKVMERCMSLKGSLVQTDVVAMCVEYCRACSYISPLMMDAAASHFTQYAYSYEPLQLFVVLRAFGQLNYLPAQPSAFLKKVESCLLDRFDHLQETHLLEILASFTFIDILPNNFYSRVCSEDFSDKINNLSNVQKSNALMWLKILKNAFAMKVSKDTDKNLSWLLEGTNYGSVYLYRDSQKIAVYLLKSVIHQLLGKQYYHVLPFYGCCAIYLNSEGAPLEIRRNVAGVIDIQGKVAKKLVFMLRSAEHFTVNTMQLLGAQTQRLKHLKDLGFVPIEVRASHFLFISSRSNNGGYELIRAYLKPYINFNMIATPRNNHNDSQSSVANIYKFWNMLGYNNECEFSSKEDIFLPNLSKNKKDKGISVEDSGLLTSGHVDDRDKDEPD